MTRAICQLLLCGLMTVAVAVVVCLPARGSRDSYFDGPPPYHVARVLYYEPWVRGIQFAAEPYRVKEVFPGVSRLESAETYAEFLNSQESREWRRSWGQLTWFEFGMVLVRNYATPEFRRKAGLYPTWRAELEEIFRSYDWDKWGKSSLLDYPETRARIALWIDIEEDSNGNGEATSAAVDG